MHTYTITSPSLDALISSDSLYFEGIRKPLIAFSLGEDMASISHGTRENVAILERYFSDIHNLFLKKLAIFSGDESVSSEASTKLQALLQEMIKVKGLIESANKAQDRGK